MKNIILLLSILFLSTSCIKTIDKIDEDEGIKIMYSTNNYIIPFSNYLDFEYYYIIKDKTKIEYINKYDSFFVAVKFSNVALNIFIIIMILFTTIQFLRIDYLTNFERYHYNEYSEKYLLRRKENFNKLYIAFVFYCILFISVNRITSVLFINNINWYLITIMINLICAIYLLVVFTKLLVLFNTYCDENETIQTSYGEFFLSKFIFKNIDKLPENRISEYKRLLKEKKERLKYIKT